MKTATREDYQRLIEIGEFMLKGAAENWHKIPVDRIPVARFGQGLDGLFLAVGHLMLGHIDKSREWFAISGQFFLESIRPSRTVISERRALECALCSGDKDFRLRVAKTILPHEGRIKPMEHSYAMFLKYTILEETQALAYADESAWLSRATMKKRAGYGTLQETCKALACRQPDEFTTTLEALLKEHKMKASHGLIKHPDGIVCFPGVALLILAREQGLSVDITSPFIPAALLE